MAKDTVRYPDQVVTAIEELVADGVVESKSEFYRFAAEYTLERIDPGYEPAMFSFDELRGELQVDGPAGERTEPGAFLEAAAAVRRAALRGRFEVAEAVIDERYAPSDREALVLEELLAAYRRGGAGPRPDEPDPSTEESVEKPPAGNGTSNRAATTDGGATEAAGADRGEARPRVDPESEPDPDPDPESEPTAPPE
jgi:Arc/MetJ-type ribon-helix-helix transcriptional regulator